MTAPPPLSVDELGKRIRMTVRVYRPSGGDRRFRVRLALMLACVRLAIWISPIALYLRIDSVDHDGPP